MEYKLTNVKISVGIINTHHKYVPLEFKREHKPSFNESWLASC